MRSTSDAQGLSMNMMSSYLLWADFRGMSLLRLPPSKGAGRQAVSIGAGGRWNACLQLTAKT